MFSRTKDERAKSASKAAETAGQAAAAKPGNGAVAKPAAEAGSRLAPGALVTGNIICDGPLQIFGQVIGDIHATQLSICAGAHVEGKVVAQETLIDGTFRGTIHSNSVKLHGNAVVEGEIYNKSLNIGENAQFEGVSRRLDKPVDAPVPAPADGRTEQLKREPQTPMLANDYGS